jgi:hypothetical protein
VLLQVGWPTIPQRPAATPPTTAEVRAWAHAIGLTVADRGWLLPEIHPAWQDAHNP